MNIYDEERECVTKDHLHQEEQETLNSKDIEIAARELPTHLGGGVRGYVWRQSLEPLQRRKRAMHGYYLGNHWYTRLFSCTLPLNTQRQGVWDRPIDIDGRGDSLPANCHKKRVPSAPSPESAVSPVTYFMMGIWMWGIEIRNSKDGTYSKGGGSTHDCNVLTKTPSGSCRTVGTWSRVEGGMHVCICVRIYVHVNNTQKKDANKSISHYVYTCIYRFGVCVRLINICMHISL